MTAILRCLALLVLLALPGGVVAQADEGAPPNAAEMAQVDYGAWEETARRAEAMIEQNEASNTAFQTLRNELTGWRGQFLAAENANAARIATLERQIEALGPMPEGDEPEPVTIAEHRSELAARLAEAQVPRVQASTARGQADGLIAEIDGLLRDRQQRQLLQLEPSPANPVNWAPAISDLLSFLQAAENELFDQLTMDSTRRAILDNAPLIAVATLLGLVALLRGRRWVERLADRLSLDTERRGRVALVYLVSLFQIVIPVIGVLFLFAAIMGSRLPGEIGMQLVMAGVFFIIITQIFAWLSHHLFPRGEGPLGIIDLNDSERAAARRRFLAIGALTGLFLLLETVTSFDEISQAASGVIMLPAVILLALALIRFSRVLQVDPPSEESEDSSGFTRRLLSVLSRGLFLVGIIAPALALIGYRNAAEAILAPTVLTLALLGVLVSLQPVIRDLYALVFRTSRDKAGEALMPVLVNFLLGFAVLPIIGRIWGMRPEQLTEIYSRFWEGIPVGAGRVTPADIFSVVLVFGLGYLLTRLLQGALKSTVLPRTKLDPGARNAVSSAIGYVGIGLAALLSVTAGGIDLTALGFLVGALSVGIGFGLQNVVNNFVSGIILLIERPISEGDWIEVGSNMGIVKSISVRSTRIETFDRTDVIVPNADLISGTVTNWTRGNTIGRAVVSVGVAYGTDTRRVQQILLDIARTSPDVAAYPEPAVDFMGFGADSLEFRVRAILRDVNKVISVKTELNHRIAERFAEEGIEIPFAQRDIWLRNPEALGRTDRPEEATARAPDTAQEIETDTGADMAPEPGPDTASVDGAGDR